MSLVSEALRKARAQQHRRELEAGQLPPAVAPPPAPRRGLPAGVLLVASLLSGAAGAGVVALLFLRPHGEPTAPRIGPQERPPAPEAFAEPPGTSGTLGLGGPPPKPEASRLASGPPVSNPGPTVTPTPTPVLEEPPHPAVPASAREFVVEANVGGTTLHLDFLVYGAGKSFARINGQDVAVGSVVAGHTVEAIGEDRVILRGPTGTVTLKVR
ncbi:MAG: hypothetical protein ACP5NF_07200 [Thermoanaerobaculum sp.]